jgi:hypothetical protein
MIMRLPQLSLLRLFVVDFRSRVYGNGFTYKDDLEERSSVICPQVF